jgi:hypothetical protein
LGFPTALNGDSERVLLVLGIGEELRLQSREDQEFSAAVAADQLILKMLTW